MIRFPSSMKNELKELAHANYRSLNAEIVARLRRDMDREKAAALTQPERELEAAFSSDTA